jgi:hypothetical protein
LAAAEAAGGRSGGGAPLGPPGRKGARQGLAQGRRGLIIGQFLLAPPASDCFGAVGPVWLLRPWRGLGRAKKTHGGLQAMIRWCPFRSRQPELCHKRASTVLVDGGDNLFGHGACGMPEEWARFKFEIGQENSADLTTVRHIAHVQDARRIIEDGRLKAGLVYDESRLNRSRISVAWVSANTWALGSIYGTVEFQFAWADLVAGRNVYWVEAMNYRPPAYRLLLSKRDISAGLIKPYNPAKDEGPLRLSNGKYYWNGAYYIRIYDRGRSLARSVHRPRFRDAPRTVLPALRG